MKIPLFQDAPEGFEDKPEPSLQRYTYKMEELEGVDIDALRPVDLSTDAVTPVSRQPIPQVNKIAWTDMSAADLEAQHAIMENRYFTMISMGRPDVANQIQLGLKEIRRLIKAKSRREAEDETTKRPFGENNVNKPE